MRLRGNNEITTVDLPEELQFRVSHRAGWIELFLEVASTVLLVWAGWKWPNFWLRIGAGAGVLALIANWLQGRETHLSVTKRELSATGNLGRPVRTELTLGAAEVKSLEYFVGDEGEPSGLFAMTRWTRVCLLPCVSEAEANGIVGAIVRKFPQIGGDPDPHSLLFGETSEPVILGLDGRNNL